MRVVLEGQEDGEHLYAEQNGEQVLIGAMVYDLRMHQLRPAHLVTLTPEAWERLKRWKEAR